MSSNLLGRGQHRTYEGENNSIPQQVTSAPLLCHIVWGHYEKYLQFGYPREETIDLIYNGGGFLQMD